MNTTRYSDPIIPNYSIENLDLSLFFLDDLVGLLYGNYLEAVPTASWKIKSVFQGESKSSLAVDISRPTMWITF